MTLIMLRQMLQTIDNINVDVLKKPQAKEEIASKVNDKQREITNDNEGTTEENKVL